MNRLSSFLKFALAAACLAMAADMARAEPSAPDLYREHCVACHGEQRLGGMGPALLPESLQRLRPAEATAVIANGPTEAETSMLPKLNAELPTWLNRPELASTPSTVSEPRSAVLMITLMKSVGKSAPPEGVANT